MQNMSTGKSALGLDGNITALIGYLIGIIALVLVFIEKDNRFVRFHALQSVFWSIAFVVLIFGVVIVGMILGIIASTISSTLGTAVIGLVGLLYLAVFLGFFGGLIFAAIKAYGGNDFKLPLVGSFAEKYA